MSSLWIGFLHWKKTEVFFVELYDDSSKNVTCNPTHRKNAWICTWQKKYKRTKQHRHIIELTRWKKDITNGIRILRCYTVSFVCSFSFHAGAEDRFKRKTRDSVGSGAEQSSAPNQEQSINSTGTHAFSKEKIVFCGHALCSQIFVSWLPTIRWLLLFICVHHHRDNNKMTLNLFKKKLHTIYLFDPILRTWMNFWLNVKELKKMAVG